MPEFFSRSNLPFSKGVKFFKPSLTEQSHRNEVDINSIIARYRRTGVLGTPTQVREMFYGDFSAVGSFHEVQNIIMDAAKRFMELPSNVRLAFENDPARFLDAFKDDSQLQKLIDLGLVKAPDPVVGTLDNPAPIDKQPVENLQQA